MDRNFFKQFGGKINQKLIEQYQKSENWSDGVFQNLEETTLSTSLTKLPGIIYKQLTVKKGRVPNKSLAVLPFLVDDFMLPSEKTKIIWYGHSVVLMCMAGKSILIDPMFGSDTTPIAPKVTPRFSKGTLAIIDDLPEIDLILITHDHYDHLDYDSIQKLKHKTKKYFVAMGVKRHLVAWGVDANLIEEFDWWDRNQTGEVQITFTPTRHFSGRGLRDRMKSLWGGWVFETNNEKIWFSGDGGYGKHFAEIGKRLGPFDFAFMECGQYNEDWRPIHLFPEEAIHAAMDAGAKKVMPVHWGGFDLSYQHSWDEPPTIFAETAIQNNIDYVFPELGQLFSTDLVQKEYWWETMAGMQGRTAS